MRVTRSAQIAAFGLVLLSMVSLTVATTDLRLVEATKRRGDATVGSKQDARHAM